MLFLYVLILLELSLVSIPVAQQILTARAWTTNENSAAHFCWDFVGGIPTYSNSIGGLIAWIERAFDLAGRDSSNTV